MNKLRKKYTKNYFPFILFRFIYLFDMDHFIMNTGGLFQEIFYY